MARMRSVLGVMLAIFICGISTGDVPGDRPNTKVLAADYGWIMDYPAALKAARETDKLIMVVFRCVP